MNNNSFKQTKAEQDMRDSSREMDEWLKTKNNTQKSTKSQAPSTQQSSKKNTGKTTAKSNSKSLYENSSFLKTVDKWVAIQNGNSKHTAGRMRFSPGRQPGWEFKEAPQKQISQKEEKNGPDIGDFGNWLGKNVMNGVSNLNEDTMAALDFFIPTDFLGKYDPFSNLNEFYSKQSDYWEREAKEASKKMGGKGWEYSGEIVSSTADIIPDIVGMIMTGGLSAPISLAQTGGTALKTGIGRVDDAVDTVRIASNAFEDVVKNPEFTISLLKNVGKEYENAINNGANEAEATTSAIMTGLVNAMFDSATPGLVEGIFKNKGFSKFAQKVGRIVDSGTVNTTQGVVGPAFSTYIYDHDTPTFSMEDENAPINFKRMLKDFGLGVASEGVNIAIENGLNSKTNNYHNNIKTSKKLDDIYLNPLKLKLKEFKPQFQKLLDKYKKVYGEDKANEMLNTIWNKYVNGLSDEEFDEYINGLKNE